MEDTIEFQKRRIEALETENTRLQNLLRGVKMMALKIQVSDPNFDKKLSEIEVNY